MKILLYRRAMRAFKIGLRETVARERWSAARRRAFLERAS